MPGGGAALLHLSEFIPEFKNTLTDAEEKLGADIVWKSLKVGRKIKKRKKENDCSRVCHWDSNCVPLYFTYFEAQKYHNA